MSISRGDIVLGILSGDFGKPRPVLIVQTNLLNETHPSVLVCPITSHLTSAQFLRMSLAPTQMNGLLKHSEIMIDKVSAIARTRLTQKIGTLDPHEMEQVERILKFLFQMV